LEERSSRGDGAISRGCLGGGDDAAAQSERQEGEVVASAPARRL